MEIKDLYWVAGIIEGEGSFTVIYQSKYPQISVQLKMTDKDVIQRTYDIVRSGKVNGPYYYKGGKPCWQWKIAVQKEAAAFMMTIYPLMCSRRQERIAELLTLWRQTPYREQRPCPKGHPLSEFTYDYGSRQCKQCNRERSQVKRDRELLGY
jgi:hypothetical protein